MFGGGRRGDRCAAAGCRRSPLADDGEAAHQPLADDADLQDQPRHLIAEQAVEDHGRNGNGPDRSFSRPL